LVTREHNSSAARPSSPGATAGDGSGVPLMLAGLTAQAASASSLDDVVRLMSEFQFLHRPADPGAAAVAAAAAPALLAGAAPCEQLQQGPGASAEPAAPRPPKSPRRALQPLGGQPGKGEEACEGRATRRCPQRCSH
jgi:hypothetical protein